jgi:large subunit ribosomal protein L24
MGQLATVRRKIQRGDVVKIIAGDDRGAVGKVLRVLPGDGKCVVEGVNRCYRHLKRGHPNSPSGGRLSIEMPLQLSNVALWDMKTSRCRKVGFRYTSDGAKERFDKVTGESLGQISPPRSSRAQQELPLATKEGPVEELGVLFHCRRWSLLHSETNEPVVTALVWPDRRVASIEWLKQCSLGECRKALSNIAVKIREAPGESMTLAVGYNAKALERTSSSVRRLRPDKDSRDEAIEIDGKILPIIAGEVSCELTVSDLASLKPIEILRTKNEPASLSLESTIGDLHCTTQAGGVLVTLNLIARPGISNKAMIDFAFKHLSPTIETIGHDVNDRIAELLMTPAAPPSAK